MTILILGTCVYEYSSLGSQPEINTEYQLLKSFFMTDSFVQ